MKILQVIDTLEAGGAERMALNYANALAGKVEESHLCCTRREGVLKDKVSPDVPYLFLEKSGTFDFRAFQKLAEYIDKNKITIVHAHSSSWFLVTLIKIFRRRSLKIVWHDHYGNSEFLKKRPKKALQFFSGYFNGIISVNKNLQSWALENLRCRNVKIFNNFISENNFKRPSAEKLKGNNSDFKIICVANLRQQKDHYTLLKAFKIIDQKIPASLHLVGYDPDSAYSRKLKEAFKNSSENGSIFYYGEQPDIIVFLHEADLGVLSSRSEGLPLALLEYAGAGLPVVVTNVGECSRVVGKYGKLVASGNPSQLAEAVVKYYNNEKKRKVDAAKLQDSVLKEFSEKAVIRKILKFYQEL
ncbi:glycosyltransferase [Zunongwangia sp. F363]|uniref:Glycosyltransferase n=1 Tax=Autumnicola tepida TaxID=3075595 RepID=A0ABU3C9L5_9FLAO|nr:glycosyltransferase [Zunongwangia sp. F363]MDT0643027.1 glycosyltransferase [Zunongwangia sp. F363]